MKPSSFLYEYTRPKDFTLFTGSVLDFEKEAIIRLKVLQKLPSYNWRKTIGAELLEKYASHISTIGILFAENHCNENWLTGLPFSFTSDTRSYWLMRFAYASNEDARTWHVEAEKTLILFRLIYIFLSSTNPKQLLMSLNVPFIPFAIKEKDEHILCLMSFYLHMVSDILVSDKTGPILFSLNSLLEPSSQEKSHCFDSSTLQYLNYLRQMCGELVREMEYVELSYSSFYITRHDKFHACAKLASVRIPCFGGMFLIAPQNLVSLILIQLEILYESSQHICEAVADIQLPQFAELLEIIRQMRIDSNSLDVYVQIDKNKRLTHKNIEDAIRSGCIPPCMVYCINGLKTNSKLKYQARLQLTSFLNSCGMSCEDDLAYQKSYYTRIMPEEKFTREYAYGIKHIHGHVGGRKQTLCRGCNTICSTIPHGASRDGQQLEVHGCPFVHLYDRNNADPIKLKTFLQQNYRVTAHEADIEDKILGAVRNNQDKGWLGYITAPLRENEPKVACNHLFELIHGEVRIETMHPVRFFKEGAEVVTAGSLSK